MIRRILMICAIAEAVAINVASSEIVEIALPALDRAYDCDSTGCNNQCTASFQLDRVPEVVYSVWIRVSGTVTGGQFLCDFGWSPPYMEPVGMYFSADIYDSLNCHWWAAGLATPSESSTFQYQAQFSQHFGVTWEFLKSGRGDVSLSAWPNNSFVECSPAIFPIAAVTEAVLVIDADWSVATQRNSWGAIKSLYR